MTQPTPTFDIIHLPKGLSGDYMSCQFPCHNMKAPHQHRQLEANLVRTGKGRYLIGESRIDLVPGTLIWLRPEQSHLLIQFDQSFSMDIWLFEMNLVKKILGKDHPFITAPSKEIHLNHISPPKVRILENMGESYSHGESLASRQSVISYALWELQRCGFQTQNVSVSIQPQLKKALDLLHHKDFNLNQLSDHLNCHPSWLSRAFKSQLGMSLTEYRQDLKLQKFLEMRKQQPDLTLLSTALRAGFGSYAQFHRICRLRLGKEPKAFL